MFTPDPNPIVDGMMKIIPASFMYSRIMMGEIDGDEWEAVFTGDESSYDHVTGVTTFSPHYMSSYHRAYLAINHILIPYAVQCFKQNEMEIFKDLMQCFDTYFGGHYSYCEEDSIALFAYEIGIENLIQVKDCIGPYFRQVAFAVSDWLNSELNSEFAKIFSQNFQPSLPFTTAT
jgi:hypothetical protein